MSRRMYNKVMNWYQNLDIHITYHITLQFLYVLTSQTTFLSERNNDKETIEITTK